MITSEQKSAIVKAVCDAIVEAVGSAGPIGAPGGPIYAALMSHGFTLDQFEQIMGSLVRVEQLEKRGQLYFVPTANLQVKS